MWMKGREGGVTSRKKQKKTHRRFAFNAQSRQARAKHEHKQNGIRSLLPSPLRARFCMRRWWGRARIITRTHSLQIIPRSNV